MDIVEHLSKFNAQSSGRDKLCRFWQYSTKFVKWYAESHGTDPGTILKLKQLEQSLGASRKVLKFGKSLDMILGALNNLTVKDAVVRTCLVLAKLNQACYLILDHYVWFTKIGVLEADAKRLVRVSSRFWLVTLFFNILRNLHDIVTLWAAEAKRLQLLDEEKKSLTNGMPSEINANEVATGSRARPRPSLIKCLVDNPPVAVDMIKNVTDMWLPLCNLQVVNFSVGLQSVLGMISSYMGILAAWDPDYKLVPS